MEHKWRVDFYYWKEGNGFSHVETIDKLNYFLTAKEYANNIEDSNSFADYDAVFIRIVDNENDYVMSEYWWELNN